MLTNTLENKGKVWGGWTTGEYQVHFIHTGAGEAIFHIFPDGTTMLVDCGDYAALTRLELSVPVVPNPGRLAGDWVARYIKRILPGDAPVKNGLPVIDYMMLSHYHDDHCGDQNWQTVKCEGKALEGCFRSGLELVAEEFAFDTAIDRGWPNFDDPYPGHLDKSLEYDHMRRLYAALQKRDGLKIEPFRLGDTKQIVPRRNPAAGKDFQIKNITCNGKILRRDGSILNVYPQGFKPGDPLNENGMSLGVIISYGKFSFYLAGDFSDQPTGADGKVYEIEDILADELPNVTVAKVNHHGWRSMPEKIVRALAPQAWLAAIWDQLHIEDYVMARMADRTIYPGPRMFFPTVFTKERIEADHDKPFFKDIAPETLVDGVHVVLTVQPDGETYRVSCLTALDESMRIVGEYDGKA